MPADHTMTRDQRQLVEKNIPLARHLARAAWERNPNEMDLTEVTSVAYQGLVTAALRFDPTRPEITPADIPNGKAFAGYARQRINGTILDWQRTLDHVQRSYRQTYKLLRQLGYGTGASFSDLADLSGLSEEKVRSVIHAVESKPVSLHQEPDFDHPSGVDVESSALEQSITNSVADALDRLPMVQQVIITLRYYTGLELQAISDKLGMTLSMVREAHAVAVLALHESMLVNAR